MQERLQKAMASAGIASRRKCEELISSRRVSVNGSVITELGTKVDLDVDRVVVNGRPLQRPQKRYYIALNKPRGVMSAVSDAHGARTVTSFVDLQSRPLLRPVGRLDVDSEGLIFLTDDGDFLNKLTHPRHKVGKTYTVIIEGIPEEDSLKRLTLGITLEDGPTLPARDVRLRRKYREEDGQQRAIVDLTIFEGRNRQVRRMFDAIGHRVLRLTRNAIGSVRLTGLPPGGWRHLTPKEVEALLASAVAEAKTSEEKTCQTEQLPSRPPKASSSPRSSKARRPLPRRTSSSSPRKGSTMG